MAGSLRCGVDAYGNPLSDKSKPVARLSPSRSKRLEPQLISEPVARNMPMANTVRQCTDPERGLIMYDTPQGPGWWQAADHKWYPPQQHPDHVGQGPGVSAGAAPQAWPPAGTNPPGPRPQAAPDGLATAKAFGAKLSGTAWLLIGGLVVAVIATFLPFATVSYKVFGSLLGSHEVGANGAAQFVVFLLAGVAVWLAWPVLSGSPMALNRLIGLSAATFLLGALMLVWFADVSSSNSDAADIADVTPGFGLLLYGVGVVVVTISVIWLWIQRS
jgi:hypothetical protein